MRNESTSSRRTETMDYITKEIAMKKFIIAAALLLTAITAYAHCTTQTVYLPGGKMMSCTTCCSFGACETTCI